MEWGGRFFGFSYVCVVYIQLLCTGSATGVILGMNWGGLEKQAFWVESLFDLLQQLEEVW